MEENGECDGGTYEVTLMRRIGLKHFTLEGYGNCGPIVTRSSANSIKLRKQIMSLCKATKLYQGWVGID